MEHEPAPEERDPSLRAALRRALLGHAATIPLWVARGVLSGALTGRGLVLLALVDLALGSIHRRANRIPEVVDWDHFGQRESWTKAFYLPEAFAWFLVARDLFRFFRIVYG
jgi:hypothetical protein